MKERRSLKEGLQSAGGVDASLEKEFVYGGKGNAAEAVLPQETVPAAKAGEGVRHANPVGREPLTIRFRSDYAALLKRATLQRKLDGVFPNTLQDILEDALEPWLTANGYLK